MSIPLDASPYLDNENPSWFVTFLLVIYLVAVLLVLFLVIVPVDWLLEKTFEVKS